MSSGEQSGSKNGGNPSDGSTDHSTSTDSEWPVQLTPVQVSPPYEELVPNLRLYRVMSLPLSFAFKRIMKTCLNMHKMPFFHHPIFKSPNLRPLMLQVQLTHFFLFFLHHLFIELSRLFSIQLSPNHHFNPNLFLNFSDKRACFWNNLLILRVKHCLFWSGFLKKRITD